MKPLPISENQKLETENRITQEISAVKVTLEHYNFEDLSKLTSLFHNPYLKEARELFTVFHLTIENRREGKIYLEPNKFVLLDDQGNQLESFTYQDFTQFYPLSYPRYYGPSYYYSWSYPSERVVTAEENYYKRQVAFRTLFRKTRIYSGVCCEGLIVFDKIDPAAEEIKVIIPEIEIYEDNKKIAVVDFEFKFQLSLKTFESD
jgi:hypothetical protein